MIQRPNVLIVDDLKGNLFYLEILLNKKEINLISAPSGAIALLKTKGMDLALAILDVQMPVMNGYELAVKLNEERTVDKVPVIFLTANYRTEKEIIKGYVSGAVDYILKPIDNFILKSKIDVFLALYNQKQAFVIQAARLEKTAEALALANIALTESDQKYRSYIDNAPDGVFVTDETGKCLEVNNSACHISGYSKEYLIGMSFPDLFPEISAGEGWPRFQQLMKTGFAEVEWMFRHKDGSARWGIMEAVKLSDIRFLCFIKDITARRLTEEKLQKEQLFTKALLDSIPGIFYLYTYPELRMVTWNKQHETLFGFEAHEMEGRHITEWLVPEARGVFLPSLDSLLEMGQASAEALVLAKDGRSIPFLLTAIRFESNGHKYLIGIGSDVTNRKLAEEKLEASLDQLRQLTQYIEKVREEERVAISRELHDDLGQALTAVKIDLGIIRKQVADKAIVGKMDKVSALVSDTIKTVQQLTSRLRPQIIDDLGLEAAIEWYTNEFAIRNDKEVILEIKSDIEISSVASHMIFRIMQESLTNIARHAQAGIVEIELSNTSENIHFRISDDGIGITESDIQSSKSFGIMSMMERAVSLGGTFHIAPRQGRGTSIQLTIPIKKEATL